jgi:hypothetical protein
VTERYADGSIGTKGVIPVADPWRLHAGDVVGEVRMTWWGLGWLVAAAPILIIGGLVVAAVRSIVSRRWKLPVALMLGALVLDIAIVWWRPFVNADQLAFAPAPSGGAEATYVGTGLLPVRLSAHEGPSEVMKAGEVASVHVTKVESDGRLRVTLSPAIAFWFWLALVLVCFVPALYSLIVGFPVGAPEGDHE